MSHLGMKILYSLINAREGMWCERVFAPDTDFEEIMRRENIPLYGLESFDPIREFDVIGFTLQYEMCYTTVLNMLDLAGLPVRRRTGGRTGPWSSAAAPAPAPRSRWPASSTSSSWGRGRN